MTITARMKFPPRMSVQRLVAHLAQRLDAASANSVRVDGSRISFDAGIFRRVSSWNPLIHFGHGVLTVDAESSTIIARLNVNQFVFLVHAVLVVVAIVAVSVEGLGPPPIVIAVAWFWLFVMSLLFGFVGFRDFMRNAVASVPAS